MTREDIVISLIKGEVLKSPETWIAYLDQDWNQIGPRDSTKGAAITKGNPVLITLPPSTQDRVGVCAIGIYDAPEMGNPLMGWWDLDYLVIKKDHLVTASSPLS